MARWISRLTLNQTLALVAFLLGAVAVFAQVYPGPSVTLHETDVLAASVREDDRVSPIALAGWIVEGRAGYRLIDLRDRAAYAEYHVPSAESLPLASLGELDAVPTERIVVYSEGDHQAAQAWMLLRGRGYRGVATLVGGLQGWKDDVLFPIMPESPSPETQARFEKAAHVAKLFGGQPRASAGGGEMMDMATLKAASKVVAPPTPPKGGSGRKRAAREGC